MVINRPFLLIPILIEQPTWGGNYIIQSKGWTKKAHLNSLKFGQSYELSNNSKLAVTLTDTSDQTFFPDVRYSSGKKIESKTPYALLRDVIENSPKEILGPQMSMKQQDVSLLIKFTQALGNSFQLHIPNTVKSTKWTAKPESWYFFEKGKITIGIGKDCDIREYKKACKEIEIKMNEVSSAIKNGLISISDAQNQANTFIKHVNPWQYVNVCYVDANTIIDLSMGGIHHSWEEEKTMPLGNIVYEVQVDVSDNLSTIRSFDQGKILDDGSVRPIHIDDYFSFLNSEPALNSLQNLVKKKKSERIFNTPYYSTDEIELKEKNGYTMQNSFIHLFIRSGSILLKTKSYDMHITQGHSVFIPWCVNFYELVPETDTVTILKTYIRS